MSFGGCCGGGFRFVGEVSDGGVFVWMERDREGMAYAEAAAFCCIVWSSVSL